MAIPFSFPPEDDTVRLEMTLENLLMDIFAVLSQMQAQPATASAAVQQQQQPAQSQRGHLPTIAPVGHTRSTSPLSHLVLGFKTSSSSETAAAATTTTATNTHESWQQLGSELRQLADQFSCKQTESQRVIQCGSNSTTASIKSKSATSISERLICFLLPKTLSYSAATIIFVGLRLLKHKFL